jgi:hypothetical protein
MCGVERVESRYNVRGWPVQRLTASPVLTVHCGFLHLHVHAGAHNKLLHLLYLLAAVKGHERAAALRLEQQAHAVGRSVELEHCNDCHSDITGI